ncbi:MAG: ATP-binding protein [Pseudonocardiaceae bacterium]
MIEIATAATANPALDPLNMLGDRERAYERLAQHVPAKFRDARVTVVEVAAWVNGLIVTASATKMTRVQHGGSLLLLGPTGTGKTWQAYGVLRALADSGVYCDWTMVTAPDLFASLRPRAGVDSERVYERYLGAKLLVIDDLGAQKDSEWTEEYLGRLIDARWRDELATLITSNVPATAFSVRFGTRITSRLGDMCTRVVLDGPDRRLTT